MKADKEPKRISLETLGYPRMIIELLRKKSNTIFSSDTGSQITMDTTKILGVGNLSVVFESFLTESKLPVALKISLPRPNLPSSESYLSNFPTEADLFRNAHHDYLAKFYGMIQLSPEGKRPALAIELLPRKLEKLTPNEAVQMLEQAGSAAHYVLNDLGALITDLNPNQIRRRGNGDFVLYDLGSTTRSKEIGIEDIYTAPEVKEPDLNIGQEVVLDEHSLVYSFGFTVYQLLGGLMPQSQEQSMPGTVWKMTPIEGIGANTLAVLVRATSQELAARQDTIAQLAADLKEAIQKDKQLPPPLPGVPYNPFISPGGFALHLP